MLILKYLYWILYAVFKYPAGAHNVRVQSEWNRLSEVLCATTTWGADFRKRWDCFGDPLKKMVHLWRRQALWERWAKACYNSTATSSTSSQHRSFSSPIFAVLFIKGCQNDHLQSAIFWDIGCNCVYGHALLMLRLIIFLY